MEIRNPNKSHLPELIALLQACLGPAWDPGLLEDRIFYDEAYDPNHVWMAREGGRILGFLHSALLGAEAEIRCLAVAPEARRRGIGRDLLSRAEFRLSGEGARLAVVRPSPPRSYFEGVDDGSEAARFLTACGYERGAAHATQWLRAHPQPVPPQGPASEDAIAFAKRHCGARWAWAEEALSHRPARAGFDPAAGLILFEPGESLGPFWPAPNADAEAVGKLVRDAWASASSRPMRRTQGLWVHGLHGLGLDLQVQEQYRYQHALA